PAPGWLGLTSCLNARPKVRPDRLPPGEDGVLPHSGICHAAETRQAQPEGLAVGAEMGEGILLLCPALRTAGVMTLGAIPGGRDRLKTETRAVLRQAPEANLSRNQPRFRLGALTDRGEHRPGALADRLDHRPSALADRLQHRPRALADGLQHRSGA